MAHHKRRRHPRARASAFKDNDWNQRRRYEIRSALEISEQLMLERCTGCNRIGCQTMDCEWRFCTCSDCRRPEVRAEYWSAHALEYYGQFAARAPRQISEDR